MKINEFNNVVWCDLGIIILKIHSHSKWDAKMVYTCETRDPAKPIVNVYICRENDSIFNNPKTYRENAMRQGLYRGHHFGLPANLKYIDENNIAISHHDPGKIIWCYVIKYVLTLHAIKKDMLHIKGGAISYKGKSFLFLGRGGSGKTEIINALCKNGASFMANTHLLINDNFVYGIKSNVRVRDNGQDIYVPMNHLQEKNVCNEWMPIGGIFWVNYRTDGKTIIKKIPTNYALSNLQWFTESISNWEMKEDFVDYFGLDPFKFGEQMNKISKMLNSLCSNNIVYYLNADIFSDDGLSKTISFMESIR
ncbi:hypothetical protein J14TS2_52690 [Bacillus sp. J14TS2]|uniref:hypothetical protein n=1 Tax=Bacillus sp. J14TS2 TaxID=2807188 RepID=UPI001B1B34E9|nr:hypothetical protein [Bacillus sp. J14TS2]GIN74794.1 hypothetical protein J14TS2_52690 [Bacillus sp. J14TS2]